MPCNRSDHDACGSGAPRRAPVFKMPLRIQRHTTPRLAGIAHEARAQRQEPPARNFGNVRRQQTTYSKRQTRVRSRSVFATSQQNRDDERGAISCRSRNTSAAATLLRLSLSPSCPLPPNFSVNTIDEPLASFRIKGSKISSSVDGALFMSHTSPPNS